MRMASSGSSLQSVGLLIMRALQFRPPRHRNRLRRQDAADNTIQGEGLHPPAAAEAEAEASSPTPAADPSAEQSSSTAGSFGRIRRVFNRVSKKGRGQTDRSSQISTSVDETAKVGVFCSVYVIFLLLSFYVQGMYNFTANDKMRNTCVFQVLSNNYWP